MRAGLDLCDPASVRLTPSRTRTTAIPGLAATAAPPEIQRTIPKRCVNWLKQRRGSPPDTRSGLSFGVDPACGDGVTVLLEGKFARIDEHARSVSSSIYRHSGTVSPHVRCPPVVSVRVASASGR